MGTIPVKQSKSIMLLKTRAKIKSLLNEIKEEQEKTNSKNWYFVEIIFSTGLFYKQLHSVSEFYKRLSNSKTGLVSHPSNRAWWKNLNPSGFYEPYITKETLVLSFLMETKSKLNILEFKSRVKKIVPFIEIKVEIKAQKEFDFEIAIEKAFFQGPDSKTVLFGDIKKSDLY